MLDLNKYIIESLNKTEIFYHGSNTKFDKFKLEFVNTGTKKQDYGYGIYLTSLKDEAENYGKIVYQVEIPKLDSSYIDANKVYNKSFVSKIFLKLYKYIIDNDDEEIYKGTENDLKNELLGIVDNYTGNQIYGTASTYLGSDKYATDFFNELNYKGIYFKYTNAINVVIFNTDNIKIIK